MKIGDKLYRFDEDGVLEECEVAEIEVTLGNFRNVYVIKHHDGSTEKTGDPLFSYHLTRQGALNTEIERLQESRQDWLDEAANCTEEIQILEHRRAEFLASAARIQLRIDDLLEGPRRPLFECDYKEHENA